MSIFEEYFDKDFQELQAKPFNRPLIEQKNLLIAGDFFGIQKFIFERLSATKASKVVRAKSAFVQLFTLTLARYVCRELKIDESHIISSNAGKFEIISPNRDSLVLKEVQAIVDRYFIKNFYGLSGMSISYIEFERDELDSVDRYKLLRKKLSDMVEESKYKKFSLTLREPVLEYDSDINNETLCKICNIRKKEGEFCSICSMFEKLGRWLTDEKSNKKISSKKDLLIELGDFETELTLDEKIRSYIKYSFDEEIKQKVPTSFSELAEESEGVKALAIIKADVDGMGDFLKNSNITDSPESFDMFSKTLDNFFSKRIPSIMKERYPDSYTVFTGGDDLFLLGRWDSMLELAREIRNEFRRFIKSEKLTISFGIAIAKPSTPISYLAEHVEHLLEEAKALEGKDAISLFGETVKWKSYREVFDELDEAFRAFENRDINTAFLYRLLEFCQMSKESKRDPLKTMWKSKLRYSFSRNSDNLGEDVYKLLDEKIEKNPSETKMFLSEFIYKRRKENGTHRLGQ